MTLFAELMRDVREQTIPLSASLRRAKDVAHRLKSETFLDWVNSERMGYPRGANLPSYRVIRIEPLASVLNPLFPYPANARTVQIPEGMLGSFLSEFTHYPLGERVDELEHFVASGRDVPLSAPEQIIQTVRQHAEARGEQPGRIQRVWAEIPLPMIGRVLAAVHDHLFDFLLKLRDEYPDLAKKEEAYEQVRALQVEGLARTMIWNQNCDFKGGQGVTDKSVTVGSGAHVGGNLVVADAISGSFNTISGLRDGDPLKELLSALAKAVQAVAETLPADKSGTMLGDLKSMVEEATNAARPGMLKAIGEQLKAGATWVANTTAGAAVTGALNSVLVS